IQSTGGYLGVTTDDLHAMAENLATGAVSINQANEALLAAGNSGRTTAQNIQMVATAALNMSQVTGVNVKKAVEDFSSLEDKPLQAALKLNEQYHFLTEATYDQIAAFEKEGLTEQAAAVAQEAFAGAFAERAANMKTDQSAIARGWDDITNSISNAWEALKHNISTNTLSDQIKSIDAEITQLQQNVANVDPTSAAGKWAEQQIEDLETQKEALQVLQRNQEAQASNQGSQQQQTTDYIDYSQEEAKAKQHEDKLTEIHQGGISAQLAASQRMLKQDVSDLDTIEQIQTDRYESDVAAQERAVRQKLTLGEISKTEELAELRDLENQKYQLQAEELDKEIALQPAETEAYNKLLLKKEQLLMAHSQRVGVIEDQMVQANVQRYQAMLAPINSAIETSVNGIIQGTTTGKQAFANLGMAIVDEFIQAGLKMVSNWIADEAAKTAATQTGNAVRTTSSTAAVGLTTINAAQGADTAITANAAQAASGSAASVSAIPVVGWAMALEVGAATLAAVLAYKGLASASGGWGNVPEETWTLLHPNEMVLPAPIAEGARNMFKAASGGGGQGGVPLRQPPARR
ncbi:MAG: phage tail length tape measure family protein, partial [Chloroflexota bacterium]